MKAIRVHQFGGPEVQQLEDVEVPLPGNEEVLVRVKAAGVNPYDTYMRSGAYGAKNPALPYTPGSDAAGTVESVGPGGDHLKIGARVYTTGTLTGAYAEFALCRIDRVHPFRSGSAMHRVLESTFHTLRHIALCFRSLTPSPVRLSSFTELAVESALPLSNGHKLPG